MKILINAYACSPNMGSEQGMGWNWIINLSNYCELYVITEGQYQDEISAYMSEFQPKNRINFHYLPVGDRVRAMCWNQGDWRFYWYYRKWQKRALKLARELVLMHNIDLIHQLNMIGFREPGYLWKIDNVPFVWGPMSVDAEFPIEFIDKSDVKRKLFFSMKNFISLLQLRFSWRVRSALSAASLIFAANSRTINAFRKYYDKELILMNETGCNVNSPFGLRKRNLASNKKIKILWVGKFDFRKQLGLALRTLSLVKDGSFEFDIVGGGNVKQYMELAKDLGIIQHCNFSGLITHKEVQLKMVDADILFFTSISEGTPHVVLEALANGLPVICFNICGQGDVVTSDVGIKIDIVDPVVAVFEFASHINDLIENREMLMELSNNTYNIVQFHEWSNKAERMFFYYKSILS